MCSDHGDEAHVVTIDNVDALSAPAKHGIVVEGINQGMQMQGIRRTVTRWLLLLLLVPAQVFGQRPDDGIVRFASVAVDQSDVFDYLHTLPDGSESGNTTGAIIEAMQEEIEAQDSPSQ